MIDRVASKTRPSAREWQSRIVDILVPDNVTRRKHSFGICSKSGLHGVYWKADADENH